MLDFSSIEIMRFVLYPVILISISIYMSISKEMTMNRFFFASRNTNWFVLGMSLLTSSLISPYIFGFSSSGSVSIIPFLYGIFSTILISIMGWFLAPLFLKMNLSTLPEYFEKRYNQNCRLFVSVIFIFSNVFVRSLIVLVIGNYLLRAITGADAYLSIFFFLFITCIYLIIGGLHAEIYVSFIQIILIVSVILFFAGWVLSKDTQLSLGLNKISLSTPVHPSTNKYSLLEFLFGLPIIGFGFWCIDQCTVQKILSIRDSNSTGKASIVSGLLQIVPILFFIISGIIINNFSKTTSEVSLSSLINNDYMPAILKIGLILAIISALMASFASIFNSTTILVTLDFYRSFKKNATDRQLVLIGRLTTIGVLLLSILLIPLSEKININFVEKLFGLFCYLIVMITSIFLMGLFIKKIQARNVLITLTITTILILLRSIFELFITEMRGTNVILDLFLRSNFLGFSIFIFLLSAFLLLIIDQRTMPRLFWKRFKKGKMISPNNYELNSTKKVILVFPLVLTITSWLIKNFLTITMNLKISI